MFREHTHDPQTGRAINAGRSGGSMLPKILAAVALINLLRMVAQHKRGAPGGSSSWRERRKSMVAELHRQLHRQDAEAETAEEPTKA